jgi:hypothetical protein
LADYGGTLTWGLTLGLRPKEVQMGLGFPFDWIDLVEAEPITVACFYRCKGASSQQVLFSQILLGVKNINILKIYNFFFLKKVIIF